MKKYMQLYNRTYSFDFEWRLSVCLLLGEERILMFIPGMYLRVTTKLAANCACHFDLLNKLLLSNRQQHISVQGFHQYGKSKANGLLSYFIYL